MSQVQKLLFKMGKGTESKSEMAMEAEHQQMSDHSVLYDLDPHTEDAYQSLTSTIPDEHG